MSTVRGMLLMVLGLGLGLLIYQFLRDNADPVVVDFWIVRSRALPLGLVVLAGVAIGMVAPLVLLVPRWWRQRRRTKSLKRRIRELEQEIAQTRNLAITAPVVPTADAPERDLPPSGHDERATLSRISGEDGEER